MFVCLLSAAATERSEPVTYDQLHVNSLTSPSYAQIHLPTPARTAGPEHNYYNVTYPSHINTDIASPYQQLNIDTQRPVLYQHLTT